MRLASVGCAASQAFAFVFAPVLATALALTVVQTFACVFGQRLFFLSHGLEGDARIVRRARGVGSHGGGASQQPGNCGASDDCFRRFHVLILFCMWLISVEGAMSSGPLPENGAVSSFLLVR